MSSKALVRCYTKRRRGLRKALPLRVEQPQVVFTVICKKKEDEDSEVEIWLLGNYKTKRGALQCALIDAAESMIDDCAFHELFAHTPEQRRARDVNEQKRSESSRTRLESLRQTPVWKILEAHAANPAARDLGSELDKLDSSETLNQDLESISSEIERLTTKRFWDIADSELYH